MPGISNLPTGWMHLAFEEIDSTNAEAMRRAAAGDRGPLWITARHQTKGRGRSGRPWASAEGSLAATLLFQPDGALSDLPQLSLVAGVATHEAIAAALPTQAQPLCRLKWPNDVLIDGAKVSGILVESAILGAAPVVALGIGINAGAAPVLADCFAAGLMQHGSNAVSADMGRLLAVTLARWLGIWQAPEAGFAAVRTAWLERAFPIGERMTVHAGDDRVSGRFAGLDPDGSLLLHDEAGTLRRFTFGDVALGGPNV